MKRILLFIGLILPFIGSAHDWEAKTTLNIAGLTKLKYHQNHLYGLQDGNKIVTIDLVSSALTTVVDAEAIEAGTILNSFDFMEDGNMIAVGNVTNKLYFFDNNGALTNSVATTCGPRTVMVDANQNIWCGGVGLEVFDALGTLQKTILNFGSKKGEDLRSIKDLMLLKSDKFMLLDRNRGIFITDGSVDADGNLVCSKKYRNNDQYNRSLAVAESANFFMVLSQSSKVADQFGVFQFDKKMTGFEFVTKMADGVDQLKGIAGSSSEIFVSTSDNLIVWKNNSQVSTSINDKAAKAVRIYPNPADQWIHIESKEMVYNYAIHDITGCSVLEGEINARRGSVNVSSLVAGIYMIELKNNSNRVKNRLKFIKK